MHFHPGIVTLNHNEHLLNLVQPLYLSVQTSHSIFPVKSLHF